MNHPRVLADLPRVHAAERAQRPALIFEDRVTSHDEWNRRCSQVARGLIAALGGPQTRVGVLSKNCDRFFDIWLGAAKANMVLAVVNWRLAPAEICQILNDAQAEMLFIGEEYLPLLGSLRRQVPGIKTVLCIDGPADGCLEFEAWRAQWPESDPNLAVSEDDVAIQFYTSGTTGLPKGVQLSNRNLRASMELVERREIGEWTAEDVTLLALPLFHAGGACLALWGLYRGGSVVVLRETSGQAIIEAFRRHPISKTGLVPAVIASVLDHPDCGETDFSTLKLMTYGGSPITQDLLRRIMTTLGCGLIQMYGMTETGCVGTVLRPEDHDVNNPTRLTSCGRACGRVALKIVGPDGAALGPNESGEILLKGDCVMKGYWNQPAATAAAIRDGWYHTGDAGYLDADGYLYVRDRIKDMIISGGENIYPAEVENVLIRHPGIVDVAVIGVPDARWGEAVKAFVVRRPGSTVGEGEVIAYARDRIASFKCPKSVTFTEVLPRNASGKLLKRVLREPYWPNSGTRDASRPE